MQALVLDHHLSYRQDLPIPHLSADEALIRLSLAGICATDLQLVKGYAGFSGILGHEFVGVVEAVGDDRHRHWLQQRVVGSINIGCGHCQPCLQEGAAHCAQRKVLGIRGHDGAFADYLSLPVANLFAVADSISDEQAVFCEPLAAAMRVVQQLQALQIESRIAVVGPGRLGMLIAKALDLAGYQVDVLGRSPTSLALPQRWQLNNHLITTVPDNHYACVVDSSGQAQGFSQALRITQARGTLLLKSSFTNNEAIDLNKIVVAELNVLGSRCGPFSEALKVLDQQKIAVTDLIDAVYPLNQGLAAFTHAAQPGVRKIVLCRKQ